ncbi:hypothetical protein T07_3538 [Trichinella nelsoni]|uniref:Uncharacterized protein n=1 Tax=Trichinella nelsoni TaxID=6336 RepID=A0A0V0RC44_9BILA|nr:hypothetical protein T07_3538 [Trichinella nelsoni]
MEMVFMTSAPEIASAPAETGEIYGIGGICVSWYDSCTRGRYCRYSKETSWEVWTNRVEVQRKDDRARDS